MNITLQQVEKILKGDLAFSQLAFSMMLTRLKTKYARNPSQATLESCADEINFFLEKFNRTMGHDYEVIKNL